MNDVQRAVLGCGLVVICGGGLVACGGSSKSSTTSATTSATAAAGSGTADAGRGFGGQFDSPAIQTCLKAAGITIPTRAAGAVPSGSFTRPSGTFTRPSGGFTGPRPSGSFPGRGGFGGNSAEATKIQQALKACGITLPTGRRSGTPAPTATPSGTG